jgi:serine/threonine protein kinase
MSAFEENGNEYELGKVLSREKDSHTYEITLKSEQADGRRFLARRIFSVASDRVRANRASAIVEKLTALSSNRLLPVVDSFILSNVDSGGRDLCLVYEKLPKNSLAHKLGENSFKDDLTAGLPALELSDVMDVFFGTLAGLEYLHSNHTHHMDLRPETILFPGADDASTDTGTAAGNASTDGIVLTNYGLVDIIAVNTMEFIAPEVHKGALLLPDMMGKVDIWAVCTVTCPYAQFVIT